MNLARFFVFLSIAAGAASGQPSSVISGNAVGFVKVAIPPAGGFNLVSVGFDAMGGGDLTFFDIFGTNQLIKSDYFEDADKVYLWDRERQVFIACAQKPSGQFHTLENWAGGSPTNPAAPAGSVMWLQSPASAATERTVCIAGQAVAQNVSTNTIVSGCQCIGSPFSCELVLTNNDWPADGGTGSDIKAKADHIAVWNGSDYDRYGLAADGQWYSLTNWITSGGQPVTRILFPGMGGWYLSGKGSAWTWTEVKPYSWP